MKRVLKPIYANVGVPEGEAVLTSIQGAGCNIEMLNFYTTPFFHKYMIGILHPAPFATETD